MAKLVRLMAKKGDGWQSREMGGSVRETCGKVGKWVAK